MTERKAISAKTREAVAMAQGWLCTFQPKGRPICKADLRSVPFQVDHIHALVHGGENSILNYRALCVPCHRIKSKQDVGDNAKVKRLRGETCTGPKAKIKSAGFRKDITKGFDGKVRKRV